LVHFHCNSDSLHPEKVAVVHFFWLIVLSGSKAGAS